MYKVINYIKTHNWEGMIIEDTNTKEKFITNGVKKWEAREERLRKITIVDQINIDKFMEYWNRNIGRYNELKGVVI